MTYCNEVKILQKIIFTRINKIFMLKRTALPYIEVNKIIERDDKC